MDLLTHTLSGLAVGTVVAGRSTGTWRTKSIILFSGLGGALPDIDAISMWVVRHDGQVLHAAYKQFYV